MTPLAVSAVIPTYNREHLVARAIRSALAALAPGDEIIVVDDGSTDGTAAVVEGFGAPVRLLRLPHGGAGTARNAGLAAARGPLVAFLDSDDEWFPDKIDLQRAFLERRPDILYAFSDFGVRLEDGTEHRNYLTRWLRTPRPLSDIFGPSMPYSSVAPSPAAREDFAVHIGSMYLEEMRNNVVAAFTLMVRKVPAGVRARSAPSGATSMRNGVRGSERRFEEVESTGGAASTSRRLGSMLQAQSDGPGSHRVLSARFAGNEHEPAQNGTRAVGDDNRGAHRDLRGARLLRGGGARRRPPADDGRVLRLRRRPDHLRKRQARRSAVGDDATSLGTGRTSQPASQLAA